MGLDVQMSMWKTAAQCRRQRRRRKTTEVVLSMPARLHSDGYVLCPIKFHHALRAATGSVRRYLILEIQVKERLRWWRKSRKQNWSDKRRNEIEILIGKFSLLRAVPRCTLRAMWSCWAASHRYGTVRQLSIWIVKTFPHEHVELRRTYLLV